MLSIYACTLLICAASLVAGRAILALLGRERPAWLSGATGFAALVVAAPLLIRLPGRATTAAIVLGLALVAAAVVAYRDVRRAGDAHLWSLGAGAALIVIAVASLPFLISEGVGVLGQGVYTNDHAAQLYWTDWLQHGFGPQPSAVRFGYPVGPQALVAIAATATGANLVAAFNGLLLAIPALTALTALGGLTAMPPGRRIAIAALCGLPYLAASFLAQSAFKETAMALFVLAFALCLQGAMPAPDRRARSASVAHGDRRRPPVGRRERVHVQRSRARLVRVRGADLARARGAGRPQPGELERRARRAGTQPGHGRGGRRDPDRDRGGRPLARPRVRLEDRGRAGIGREAELARVPGRGARHLAGRRLPHRPRRGRRVAGGGGRRRPRGSVRRPRARPPPPARAAGDAGGRRGGLRRGAARRRDSRGGQGAGGRRPARRARLDARAARPRERDPRGARRRGVRRRGGLDPAGAARRARRRRHAPGPARGRWASRSRERPSPSSASTASPATTCAARWRGPRPATSPRRSRPARTSAGLRASRPTSTASTPGSSTASAT